MDSEALRAFRQSDYLQAQSSNFIQTPHFLFHYIHAGSGRPLILVHGGGMWLYSFRHNLTPLSKASSVYALDMPGYGYTGITDPSLGMGPETMPLALKEFMDALCLDKASIVGHSWGGGWALAFAIGYPERADRIVLINSGGIAVRDVFEWELLKMPVVGSMLLRFLTPCMIRKRLELSFHKKGIVDDAMAREVYLPMTIPANRAAQALVARSLSWQEVEGRMGELGHKFLLIWGEKDRYLNVGLSDRFRERIKDLRVEIIKDCGHSAHEEAPDLVNALIESFLSG